MSDVTASGFSVRLQNPSSVPVVAETVNYVVVEQGVWQIDGVKIEARTYASTVTDSDASWVGQVQAYGQAYTNPVVLGQVMTTNDDWSMFWTQGSTRTSAPSPTRLVTGKMVGEDGDTTRASETIGIIVIEAGHGTLAGVEFEAGVGPNTVQGPTMRRPMAIRSDTRSPRCRRLPWSARPVWTGQRRLGADARRDADDGDAAVPLG